MDDLGMIFIYLKSNGKIVKASSPEKNLQEMYGEDWEEYSQIFDYIYMPYNDFIFYNYYNFKVDLESKKLIQTDEMLNLTQYIK